MPVAVLNLAGRTAIACGIIRAHGADIAVRGARLAALFSIADFVAAVEAVAVIPVQFRTVELLIADAVPVPLQ